MNRKNRIKAISFLLSFMILFEAGFANISGKVYAYENKESYLNEDDCLEINEDEYYISQDSNGFVNIIDNDSNGSDLNIREENISLYGEEKLPLEYSSVSENRITSVKDQGSYPNCWAFSTIGAIESSILTKDSTISNKELDISETRLIYDFYHRENMDDPMGNTNGDYTYAKRSVWYNNMGNQQLAMWPLINGECAFDEDKESDYSFIASYKGNEEDYFNSDYIVKEAKFFEEYNKVTKTENSTALLSPSTENEMKKHIMDEGSVIVGIKMSSVTDPSSDSTYSYDSNKDKATHAVLIVGWDDTIDKNKFRKSSMDVSPKRDGAWLVKNSYGTGYNACSADGMKGYFWLSYDDTTISSITGLSAEKKGNFDHIFYYDGGTGTSSLSVPSDSLVYNIYTNNTKCTQKIKAVGIGIKTASGKGVNYKYQVYKNPDPDNDEMGTPLLSDYQYGVNYFSGYHTDELKEDVIINPGEKFAVAYSFSEKVSVYIDKESNSASWYGVKVGEKQDSKYSYYMYMDLSSKYDSPVTLRIKAYSVDVKDKKGDSNKEDDNSKDGKDPDDKKDGKSDEDNGSSDNDGRWDNDEDEEDEDEEEYEPKIVDENQGEIEYRDYIKYCKNGIPGGIWIAGIDEETRYTYNGEAKKPNIRIYDYNKKLIQNEEYVLEYKNNINASESTFGDNAPQVIVTFKGDYHGSKIIYFKIQPKEITNKGFVINDIVKKYTGKSFNISPLVYDSKGKKLRKNCDYKIDIYTISGEERKLIKNPYEKGEYEIEVSGINNYKGSIISKLIIVDREDEIIDISKAKVKGIKKKMGYTGESVCQNTMHLQILGKNISPDLYKVRYVNNILPGKATIVISGIGGESKTYGTKIINFSIKGYSIKKCKITYDKKVEYVNGKLNSQLKIISISGNALLEKTDYTVKYELSKNRKKAKLVITGIGKYTGKVKKNITITQKDISSATVSYGEKVSPLKNKKAKLKTWVKVSVSDNGVKVLREGKDYKVKFYNTQKCNYFIIKGIGDYKGTIGNKNNKILFDTFVDDINKISFSKADVHIKDKYFHAYGVTLEKEDIKATIDNHELVYGEDYIIAGYLGNYEAGTAKVFIEGKGEYTGVYMYEFNIKKNTK